MCWYETMTLKGFNPRPCVRGDVLACPCNQGFEVSIHAPA